MRTKPEKPYVDFPLYAHSNGQWAKRIRGVIRYFGKWDDWEAAVRDYENKREALYAGRNPIESNDGLSVRDGCDEFLASKVKLLKSGEIKDRTYNEYHDTCKRIIEQFGKERSVESLVPSDFDELRESLAAKFGPVRLTNEITRVKSVFRYLDDATLIDRPVRFGPNFKRPSARLMRLSRAQSGSKLFTNDELQKLLKKANSRMRAMIYLGINCGLGNMDIGQLHYSHLWLKDGWLIYPRPKTGITRKAKLWPETIAALKAVPRRKPADPKHATLFFLTQTGHPWAKDDSRDTPIGKEMTKLLTACGIRRKGLSFYALRHTFQTIAEGCKDLPAVKAIMGHAPASGDMSAHYRQLVDDDRLKGVASYVRAWLNKPLKKAKKAS